MAAASNRPPLPLKPAGRSRLLLAHDLQRCIWLLGFVPQQYEAARLTKVLQDLIDNIWPTPITGAAGRHNRRPK